MDICHLEIGEDDGYVVQSDHFIIIQGGGSMVDAHE